MDLEESDGTFPYSCEEARPCSPEALPDSAIRHNPTQGGLARPGRSHLPQGGLLLGMFVRLLLRGQEEHIPSATLADRVFPVSTGKVGILLVECVYGGVSDRSFLAWRLAFFLIVGGFYSEVSFLETHEPFVPFVH